MISRQPTTQPHNHSHRPGTATRPYTNHGPRAITRCSKSSCRPSKNRPLPLILRQRLPHRKHNRPRPRISDMRVKPLANHVLLRKLSGQQFSAGGIFLGENEENTGEVIAVGPGKWGKNGKRETMWGLQPGDRVVFSPNGNAMFKIDGEEFVMVRRDAIIGEFGEEEAA